MDDMPQNEQPENSTPIIPPSLFLIAAAGGLILALTIAFTQPTFGVIGIAGIAVALIALIGWALLAPDQLRGFVTGRTFRFGGTSLIVTLVFIVALIAIYVLVRGQNWRFDLTANESFTLNEPTREAIRTLGADPVQPPVKLFAFYGIGRAGLRDQHSLLLEDYRQTSGDKITYEFVDPERRPLLVEQYGITQDGEILVATLNESGEPDLANAERVSFFNQEQLTNAIFRVAASGDFRAYFLSVEGGLTLDSTGESGLSTLNDRLVNQFRWTTQQVSLLDLIGGSVDVSDPAADGTVLVIPGGTSALEDASFNFLTEYLENGGDLVILADVGVEQNGQVLATAENLNDYLFENYGLRFSPNIVLDTQQAFQSADTPYATDFSTNNFITQQYTNVPNAAIVFEATHYLETAATAPANVTITELVRSSAASYAKSIDAILNEDAAQLPDDPVGPFILAAAAEDLETGSRIVLIGSRTVPINRYVPFTGLNIFNIDFGMRSLMWPIRFDEFATTIPQFTPQQTEQDLPLFAQPQTLSTINFITVIVMPFGVLLLGFFIWQSNRSRSNREM
jgi:hypothetical protein